MSKLAISLCLTAFLFALTLASTATDEEAPEEGLYTEEQAERGEEAYATHCQGCHRADLEGLGIYPPLAGEEFWERWEGRSAYELYRVMHDTMPLGRGGALEEETYADIFAYMLSHYGYPAGEEELVADEEFLDFELEPQDKAEDEEND
jgi:mono/diheme cytochrome c family protein